MRVLLSSSPSLAETSSVYNYLIIFLTNSPQGHLPSLRTLPSQSLPVLNAGKPNPLKIRPRKKLKSEGFYPKAINLIRKVLSKM